MSAKSRATDTKVTVLKGQEAEDKVLEYLKRANRPYGAVDVAANLKGAIPKTATQKILVALAEKGELVQKTYGKTTFFVVNQSSLEDMPSEKLKALEDEHKCVSDTNKGLETEVKTLSMDLAKLKTAPTDTELNAQLTEIAAKVQKLVFHLQPLRSGVSLVSAEDLAHLEADWDKWRVEWTRRKKVFNSLWSSIIDALPPQDATELADDLGIEFDTQEHTSLEKGPLCVPRSVLGKRTR